LGRNLLGPVGGPLGGPERGGRRAHRGRRDDR